MLQLEKFYTVFSQALRNHDFSAGIYSFDIAILSKLLGRLHKGSVPMGAISAHRCRRIGLIRDQALVRLYIDFIKVLHNHAIAFYMRQI